MSGYAYDPYARYRIPSIVSYPYAPPLSIYADSLYSTRELPRSQGSDRVYYNVNGKPTRSYKSRNYRNRLSSWYSRELPTSQVSDRIYFNLNGKLASFDKIRDYRRAQKHVLNLYPDAALQGIASSRIQFYVMRRPGYGGGQYTRFRSYISKRAWEAEIDNLELHETVGIEVRKSVSASVTESVSCFLSSFFDRTRFKFF